MIVKRTIEPAIEQALKNNKAVVILGARQVGKTTLAKSLCAHHASYVYLNLDDLYLQKKLADTVSLTQVLEETFKKPLDKIPQGSLVVIDECQKYPQVLDMVKYLYDAKPKKFKWLLTGSNALQMRGKSSESLSGRAFYFYLSPFSWRETLLAKNIIRDNDTCFLPLLKKNVVSKKELHAVFLKYQDRARLLLRQLDDCLVFGNYPEVVLNNDPEFRFALLNNYHKTYIEKDILQPALVAEWKGFDQLLEVIATTHGSTMTLVDLCAQTHLARDTVKKYLSILEQSFIFYEIEVFSRQAKKRILKASKREMNDMGLVSILSRATSLETLKATGAIGTRLENWVCNQFKNAFDNDTTPPRLAYWRTTTGSEVDLIIDFGRSLCVIEIKCAHKISRDQIKGLLSFCAERKEKLATIVIYCGEFAHDKDNNIFYLPVWGLF